MCTARGCMFGQNACRSTYFLGNTRFYKNQRLGESPPRQTTLLNSSSSFAILELLLSCKSFTPQRNKTETLLCDFFLFCGSSDVWNDDLLKEENRSRRPTTSKSNSERYGCSPINKQSKRSCSIGRNWHRRAKCRS